MKYIKIYEDIRQSRLCSAHLETRSGPRAEGVSTNNQRERGSEPCLLWGGLDKPCHIVPAALLVRVYVYIYLSLYISQSECMYIYIYLFIYLIQVYLLYMSAYP